MEIEGIISRMLPPVTGNSQRGAWTKQEVIIELPSEFNKKVCIAFWGDKIKDITACTAGEKVKISINVESREHNGRWYTEVRGWRVERGGAADNTTASAPLEALQEEVSEREMTDDLPF